MRNVVLIYSMIFLSLLLSCRGGGSNTVTRSGERNNIETVEVVSMDDLLPSMCSNTHFLIAGDSLIFHDYHDTNLQFKVYDLVGNRYVGAFGKFGNGPGEIANFTGGFYDPSHRVLYGMNCNQWNIVGFDVAKALNDSTYGAFVKMKMDYMTKPRPFLSPVYIDDSTIICVFYIPDEKWKGLTAQLGILNLVSQDVVDWTQTRWEDESRCMAGVSVEDSLIVTAYSTHDLLFFYDLSGNLKRTVYGSDFEDKHRSGFYYFYGKPIIADNQIFCIYVGDDIREVGNGQDIVVMDLMGNYIKTLRTGLPLKEIAYHPTTNRLYLSTDGDPQFGYIELSDQ